MSSDSTPADAPAAEASQGQGAAGRRIHIRILVADDQPLIRHGLGAMLQSQPDFTVVGEVSSGDDALHLARTLAPDVVLLDVRLQGLSGIDVMRELHATSPARGCRFIVFSPDIDAPALLPLIRYGARGLIPKSAPVDVLFRCIRTVGRGGAWFARRFVDHLVESLARDEYVATTPPRDVGLTAREREILRLFSRPIPTRVSPPASPYSEDTVKHHLTRIFDKTGASTRLELALFAMHHRLLS